MLIYIYTQRERRYHHPKTRGTKSNPAGPPSGLAVAGDISKVGVGEWEEGAPRRGGKLVNVQPS